MERRSAFGGLATGFGVAFGHPLAGSPQRSPIPALNYQGGLEGLLVEIWELAPASAAASPVPVAL